MWYLFLIPLFVDVAQVATNNKPEIDIVILLFAVIPALIGAIVRVLHEGQKIKVTNKRKFYVIVCAITLSYGVYVAADFFEISRIMGLLSIVVGVISVDIVHWLISESSTILTDLFSYWLNRGAKKNRDDDFE